MTDLIEQLLGRIREQRKRVVIVGDTMLDRWVHGRIEPCMDGCPKFAQEGEVVDVPGGAANAEHCLIHWNMLTSLYGYAQNDCPVKTRYVEDGKIVFRADEDGSALLRGAGYQWARVMALEMVECANGVLLSDYDKGFLTPEFIREVVTLCRARNVPCVADCKRAPELYVGCVLKGNYDYAEKYPIRAMCENGVVVTHGADSPWYCKGGPMVIGVTIGQLLPVKCVNHVGAGDCFAAHLTLALTYGFSLKEAAALAHSAGRVYVQHEHNRPPHPREVAADLSTASL